MHPSADKMDMRDAEKEIKTSCEFKSIRACGNGLFIVGNPIKEGEHLKYGVIDSKGNYVIPMDYISIVEEFGKYFRVRRLSDDKTAIINMNGSVIIDFGKYALWWSFWGGYIKVKKQGCYGLLDSNLDVALPCKYSDLFACLDEPHKNCYGIKEHPGDKWLYLDNETLKP